MNAVLPAVRLWVMIAIMDLSFQILPLILEIIFPVSKFLVVKL